MKKTKRKAFNFMRSYFDVLNELKEDSDKLNFLMSIINKQFLNEDPKELDFVVKLCYESQRHSIESSVKGWVRAAKTDLEGNPITDPVTVTPTPLGTDPQTHPKEEEEKREVEEEEKVKEKEKLKKSNELVKLEFLNCSEQYFTDKARILKVSVATIKKEAEEFWLDNYQDSADKLSFNDVRRHFGNWAKKQDIKDISDIRRRIPIN